MCKTKMAVNATDPSSAATRPTRTRSSQSPRTTPRAQTISTSSAPAATRTPTVFASSSSSDPSTSNTANAFYTTTSSSTLSSRTSLSSLRDSLSQNPHIYDISEIRAATNNFLAKRHSSPSSSSSSTACWRCNLRNSNTIVFQRKFRRKIEMSQLKQRLSVICRSHHSSVIKLLGASISGEHIYLVYDFINGANLADCLRNSKNPNFTVLSTWMSRMQVAADLASGLDYIHHKTGLNISLVHNRIKSSSIIVTEPLFNAKICHFGTAQLCGEVEDDNEIMGKGKKKDRSEITEMSSSEEEDKGNERKTTSFSKQLSRSRSGEMQFEGVRGYMSPEFQTTGIATQKSDVYAFGVVILELLSGEEPFKYRYDKTRGDFIRTSVIETATAAIDDGDGVGGRREGRFRQWIDRRLKDSFPVRVAEKVTRVALECVHVDSDKRPDMGRVAGKISRWFIESAKWADDLKISDQISVSLAPR